MSFSILRRPPPPRLVDDVGMATTHGIVYYDCVDCGVEFFLIDEGNDPLCPECDHGPLCPDCMEGHGDAEH